MNDNIRALFRGLSALRIISDTGGATCQHIANELSLSRPTVYRILETLVASGLVSADEEKVYHPTFAVRALENGVTDRAWALWTAKPTLAELQKEVVWTCEIATFENYAMVRRDSMHLENPFRIDVRDFDDRPRSMLTSAMGRAYLAFAPERETDLILRHIERFGDPVDPDARVGTQTRAQFQTVREKGYALEQRLSYPYVTSIAVPVRFRGRVLACIDVAWISRAIKVQEGIDQFVPALMRAQSEIERNLERDARD